MSRIVLAPIAIVAGLGLVTACARTTDVPSTTTVTSNTTSGVRMTAARDDGAETALRLADEMCARERSCNHIAEGARYRSEEACLADQGARGTIQVAKWSCTPTSTQASFEMCLSAIRDEHCETTLTRFDALAACRSQSVCGR